MLEIARESGAATDCSSTSLGCYEYTVFSFPIYGLINCIYLQVHGSCLVDLERDYLSLDKRYPRLFVSPELSKVN